MNVVRMGLENAAVGVAIADRPDDLDVIHKDGCAAAIWRRQTLPAFQQWIDALNPSTLPRARMILRPHLIPETIASQFQASGTPDGNELQRLIGDISALSAVFARVVDSPFIRLRLDVVSSNACRKFHIDAVTTRLICTYRGTGTQYGISPTGAPPARVFTVPTGAPILLRGTEYPVGPKSGLLHRSPPIEGTGEHRFVLVLDPVTDEEDWV
jgi:hypothetical protein